MTPNKKIPSFCFESPWVKPFGLTFRPTTINTHVRRLRATWAPELAQDVSAFHNIDAEAELTALLCEQITAEINREILNTIRPIQPPINQLLYIDFTYGEPNIVNNPFNFTPNLTTCLFV